MALCATMLPLCIAGLHVCCCLCVWEKEGEQGVACAQSGDTALVLFLHVGMMLRLEGLRRAGIPGGPTPLSAWTPEFWQRLTAGDSLNRFMRASQAQSTQSAYASQQHQYQQFCQLLGMHTPAACFQPDVLAAWVMGRSTHGYKLSTIEQGVYAVCSLARQHNTYLSASSVHVKTVLQAASRARGSGVSRKLPILLPSLQQLCTVESSSWIAGRDSAFYVLGWHGMLRGAEVAALQWEDIAIENRGIILLIRSSKTDQAGEGQFVFLHSHADSRVCPLRCLYRLSSMTPPGLLTGPIFKTHQHAHQQLSKSTMLTRLKHRLEALGLPSQPFGLHSLRSGGATAAAQQHVPERLIKIHGRWKSDTVRVYTCAVPEDRWSVSLAMGQA